jgi:DNA-binding transcriptional MerR regulator
MENDLLGIGAMASASGLSISALRFYDGAGILVPSSVDPANSYRRYAPSQLGDARLIARLRRVGLPLSDIRAVLEGVPEAAVAVLDLHLRRLEDGLADARRELSMVRTLVTAKESPMTTFTVSTKELLNALSEVRFAASHDPKLPMLGGVLLEVDAEQGVVRLAATDRYRLAVSTIVPASLTGESTQSIAPTALVDRLLLEAGGDQLTVTLDGDRIGFSCADLVIEEDRLRFDFPPYRSLLPASGDRRLPIDVASFRQAVENGPTRTMTRDGDDGGIDYQLSLLALTPSGLTPVAEPATGFSIGVNREFLLQALAAGRKEQLVLELDGQIGPLAIRDPEHPGSFSILMPVRLS